MNEPERTEWQIRCAFNGFCKRTLKNESINAAFSQIQDGFHSGFIMGTCRNRREI